MEEITSKTCKICYKEIDSRAKKCPYCQHWQNKFSMTVRHPAFALFLTMGFIVVFGVIFESLFVFDKGEDFANYRNQITINKTELKFGETNRGPTVVIVGEIKNNSALSWKDIQLEIRFYNNNGKLSDTDQENKYSFVVPANDISTFKVSIPREFPEEQYASFQVRILSAKDSRTMW